MKKLLAIIISVAIMLSTSVIPSVFVTNAETAPIYYVDASLGKDENDGLTAESPLATIKKAEELIIKDNIAQDGTIIVIDTAEFDGGVAHKGMITIKGKTESSSLTYNNATSITDSAGTKINAVVLKGPYTFDGIYCPTSNDSNYKSLVTGGQEAIFNLPEQKTAEKIVYVGQVDNTPEGTREKVVFDNFGGVSGAYNVISIGAVSKTNTISSGVDITFNYGRLAVIKLIKGTTYTGNVNIVINNFQRRNSSNSLSFTNGGPTINGAFQIIIPTEKLAHIKAEALTNMSSVEADDGTWVLRVEKGIDGSLLDTTDNAGIFKVNGGMVANAYLIDPTDNTECETAIKSVNGILDLSGKANAGVYNIRFTNRVAEPNSDSIVYVDSENGSNLADGKTPQTAFSTFEFAAKWLEMSCAEEKEIVVIGNSVYSLEEHDYKLTISGYDETSTLKMSDSIKGDTVIKNILLSFDGSKDIKIDGNEVVYENVTYTTYTAKGKIIVGPMDSDTSDDVKTQNYGTLRGHRETAEKYGLKTIKMGDKFYEHLEITGIPRDYYIKDSVHPNVEGNALYAKIISEQINRDFPYSGYATNDIIDHTKSLPEPLHSPMLDARMLDAKDIDLSNSTGWSYDPNGTFVAWKGYDIYDGVLFATEPGSVLRFEFEGKGLGLLFSKKTNIGKISVSVDDSEPVIIDGYDSSAKPGHLPITPILEDLENGTHTVTVTLLEERNEKSTSNRFQIPTFLIR